jgi:nucleoside-diphosphate-sugar epimerase
MRVFVTGATGFIGSATVQSLLGAGHQVLGLARNDVAADSLTKLGEVHRGDLTDPGSIVAGAVACDGMIHTAFIHDFSQFAANIETDRRVVEAVTMALRGSNKPVVIASGTMMIAQGRPARETDTAPDPQAGRAASETMVLTAPSVRGSVVRLPPTVHGAGDHGFVPRLVDLARAKGVSPYIGDGANRWPAVHVSDAGRLYRLALEAGAPARAYHASAEEGVAFRAIAEAIGRALDLPVEASPREHFGWLASFVGADAPVSSGRTRALIGWKPTGPTLLADLAQPAYFAG